MVYNTQNRVGVSPHLRTEADPVSETLFLSSNSLESGRWTKSENPLILYTLIMLLHGDHVVNFVPKQVTSYKVLNNKKANVKRKRLLGVVVISARSLVQFFLCS
jgi:hypothetical protein